MDEVERHDQRYSRLMVTALNEQGDIEKAVRAGCDDFLTKPVNNLELKTRVNHCCACAT